jgi:hypothetical protein
VGPWEFLGGVPGGEYPEIKEAKTWVVERITEAREASRRLTDAAINHEKAIGKYQALVALTLSEGMA